MSGSENATARGTSPTPGQSAEAALRPGLRLFAVSFTALFLELMLIRWAPSVVRLVAYYANLLLLSSFLGLGLGAMSSRRQGNLLRWFPLLLTLNVGGLLLCRHVVLPGGGGEMKFFAAESRVVNYLVLIGIFASNALLFVPLGEQIGVLFGQLPTLRAYSWDLLGSLCGTIAFGMFSFFYFSPAVGLAGVALIILGLSSRRQRLWGLPVLSLGVAALWWASPPGAIWSPYYYITFGTVEGGTGVPAPTPPRNLRAMQDPPVYTVSVNQDFYQMHGTIDLGRYSPGNPRGALVRLLRDQYLLPYALAPGRRRALVLGSGGGMDVEAALLSGVAHVDAVDIDPRLIALSRRINASGCYDDPRVTVHVNDARAFLENAAPGYDAVIFGFLDSQALFTSMSNLRLDGFTYTVESIRTAHQLLNDDGLLALSFAAGQDWLARKLIRMVADATGTSPLVYVQGAQIIICAPRGKTAVPPPSSFGRFRQARYDLNAQPPQAVATDDWPFLYLRERTIPRDYLVVIAVIVALSLATILRGRRGAWGANALHFFFLGAGFLLLETKSISDCTLYFGTTWMVTMIVVAGVLAMVLAANLLATRVRPSLLWYVPLFAALVLLHSVPHSWVLSQTFAQRLLWAVLVVPLPIFFAGIIFSTTFRGATEAGVLFGANLVGAMIGGFCEYLGMVTGNAALMLLVMAAYAASAACQIAVAATKRGQS
ncbi:MAG: hypothetical protein P4L84_30760 [Isosphaeraceae bacterium]|nr:hypothetical protein [Isosphaeraceae bacterium]